LKPGAPVVARRRLILADGQPVEIATSYYPADIAAGTPLAERAKIKGGAVAALAALGHSPVDVVDTLTARRPADDEADILRVDEGEPLLVLTHTNHDAGGRVVEHAVNVSVARLVPPHVYRMRAHPA
jgi:DNA-binding GntR family transcriptional regulator